MKGTETQKRLKEIIWVLLLNQSNEFEHNLENAIALKFLRRALSPFVVLPNSRNHSLQLRTDDNRFKKRAIFGYNTKGTGCTPLKRNTFFVKIKIKLHL